VVIFNERYFSELKQYESEVEKEARSQVEAQAQEDARQVQVNCILVLRSAVEVSIKPTGTLEVLWTCS